LGRTTRSAAAAASSQAPPEMDRGEIGHPAPRGRSNGNERDPPVPCRPSRAFRKARTLTDEFRSGDIKRLRALLKPPRERYDLATTMNRWACGVRTCDDNSEPTLPDDGTDWDAPVSEILEPDPDAPKTERRKSAGRARPGRYCDAGTVGRQGAVNRGFRLGYSACLAALAGPRPSPSGQTIMEQTAGRGLRTGGGFSTAFRQKTRSYESSWNVAVPFRLRRIRHLRHSARQLGTKGADFAQAMPPVR
jgi:hypothetical protein